MSDLNVSIIMKLVNRVGAGAREVERDLQGIRGHVDRLGRVAGRAAIATGAAAAAATGNAVRSAATMQDAWSEANKTLGYTPEQLDVLKDGIAELAQVVPLTTQELVAMAGEAGNAGITARGELLAFLEYAAKMKYAMDGLDAGGVLLNWREGLQRPIDQLEAIADQVNYLGNVTSAGARPLAEYASRALGIGEQFGYATEETLAWGAAMIAQGVAPEAAMTSFQAFNRTMKSTSDALSTTQQDVLESMGILGDWDGIQEQMLTDTTGAIRRVIEAIQTLPEAARGSAVNQLFGDEAGRNLATMLLDLDRFEAAMDRADDTLRNSGNSVQQEFEAVSNDVLDNWQRVQNAIAGKNNTFGSMFLGPLNDALKTIAATIHEIDDGATAMDRLGAAAKMAVEEFGRLILPDALVDFSLLDWLRDPSVPAGLETFVDGIAGPVADAGERLSDAWAQAGPIRDNIRSIATSIGSLFGNTTAEGGEAISLLDRLNGILGATAGIGLKTIATGVNAIARGLETLTGIVAKLFQLDWGGIGAEVRGWLSWLKSVTIPDIPDWIRNRLPGGGGSAADEVQARARGGRFSPGWLLTGEDGAELEYRSQGGYIAHHGQLREMLAMSDTIRRNAAGARPVARSARRPGASGATVTMGDIVIHAAPGMSPEAIATEVRRQIGRAARHGDDALHDGGFYDA